MSFRADAKGNEETIRRLDEMAASLGPRDLGDWINKIETTARKICDDPDGKRIRMTNTYTQNNSYTDFQFADKESMDCVIKAIEEYLHSMPLPVKYLYERLIIDLENKKKGFDKGTSTS